MVFTLNKISHWCIGYLLILMMSLTLRGYAVDNIRTVRQAHNAQLQAVVPAVKALMEYYEKNDLNCSFENQYMVPMDNQPYFEQLYADERCVVTLVAKENAAFSSASRPTIYRFWPVCEMVGKKLRIVAWRTATNADINMALFSNYLRDTGRTKVISRLSNQYEYPFHHMEFHSNPMANIASPYQYSNECLWAVDEDEES